MITIDPSLFDPAAIPEEIKKFNQELLEEINATPIPWTLDHRDIRQARKEGKGIFPFEPPHPDASTIEIDGPAGNSGGKIPLRLIPTEGKSKGTFLQIHGGGWMYGEHDQQDQRLKKMADKTGLDILSVGYRLAPEDPWPAGNDDCECAATWLAENSDHGFNTDFLAIGGDSAGGHLTATTLLRLRDKHGKIPYHAAIFMAGCFDLRMSASARQFGDKRLILNTNDVRNFAERYLGHLPFEKRDDPDISPILGNLEGMPPAHFVVGTCDPLVDDTLTMAMRWSQAQSDTELEVYPGGCHVFQYFDNSQSRQSHEAMAAFLKRQISSVTGG